MKSNQLHLVRISAVLVVLLCAGITLAKKEVNPDYVDPSFSPDHVGTMVVLSAVAALIAALGASYWFPHRRPRDTCAARPPSLPPFAPARSF